MRSAQRAIEERLSEWAQRGVTGWRDAGWMTVEARLAKLSARIVGAAPAEVAVGGTLTGILHRLMTTFYRPSGSRKRILMENSPFPSDRYAAASQARLHGLDPGETIIIAPSPGSNAGLLDILERCGEEIALVLLGGVNYYDGVAYDVPRIVSAARASGCVVGLDLAHAAGNVPLCLHDWDVDFAAWCGYKYLNGGPGAPAAFFVHERHHGTGRPRLAGWWGHDPDSRFDMPPDFRPAMGAAGWQISTPSIIALAPLHESLTLFDQVGMEAIVAKSRRLTGYLDQLIRSRLDGRVEITTSAHRGAQLSLRLENGAAVFSRLATLGVICDWREPDTIRVAPAPLYNSFLEMVDFVDRLSDAIG